jgi:hypothetical protein
MFVSFCFSFMNDPSHRCAFGKPLACRSSLFSFYHILLAVPIHDLAFAHNFCAAAKRQEDLHTNDGLLLAEKAPALSGAGADPIF